jgi:hypothetical protein
VSEQLYLHLGAMKTGTSFLQGVLRASADPLAAAGVLVAPNRSAAVHDAVDFRRASGRAEGRTDGAWEALVRRARSFDGRATVLSHEYFSLQGPARVERILASLEGLDVHAVLTVRDATGVLPAQWQTAARNNGRHTWPQYVAAAGDPATRPGSHTFLRAQRIARIIRVWKPRLAPGRLHVVTVPPPGAPRTLLWDRFAEVLGVDPALAARTEVRSNPSAGYATAHLLCLVHAEAGRRKLTERQVQRMAVYVADRAAARRAEEPVPPLDGPTLRFAAQWNRRVVRAVRRSGVELTGDLDDLPVQPDLSAARPLRPPEDDAVVAAARAAAEALAEFAPRRPAQGEWGSVDAAVHALVDLMGAAMESGGVERLNSRGTALREDR